MTNTTPLTCEHPNENPNFCPCADDCYCRTRTCLGKPLNSKAPRKIREELTETELLAVKAVRRVKHLKDSLLGDDLDAALDHGVELLREAKDTFRSAFGSLNRPKNPPK